MKQKSQQHRTACAFHGAPGAPPSHTVAPCKARSCPTFAQVSRVRASWLSQDRAARLLANHLSSSAKSWKTIPRCGQWCKRRVVSNTGIPARSIKIGDIGGPAHNRSQPGWAEHGVPISRIRSFFTFASAAIRSLNKTESKTPESQSNLFCLAGVIDVSSKTGNQTMNEDDSR